MDHRESVTKGAEQPDMNKGNERAKDEVEIDKYLEVLIEQNLRNEENPWPMCEVGDYSGAYVLFFLIQVCVILTEFTGFLE